MSDLSTGSRVHHFRRQAYRRLMMLRRRGYTFRELEAILGVSDSTLCRIAQDAGHKASLETCQRIIDTWVQLPLPLQFDDLRFDDC